MSSSLISISSNLPTHVEILDSLVAISASNLAEARAAFPTPEPGRLSPNSMDSTDLDLAPTTVIGDTSLEANNLSVVGGTTARSEEEVGSLTEVLVLERIGGEEGDSVVCCQNSCRGKCSFHGANSQACSTHGNRHIECGALLHKCECASPTLVAPSPDILHYLPSVLEGTRWAGEESHTHNAATQALEVGATRGRGVEGAQRGQVRGARRGRDGQTQGQRGQPRVSSPLVHCRAELPSPPRLCCPDRFQVNVPPIYLNVRVQHRGNLIPTNFVQVKMYDNPIVLGTVSQGFPIFCQPVHAVQTLLPFEASLYMQQEVLILHNRYPGRAWVNQALADKGDDRLQAEVHCYQSLMDEADRKEHELSTIQDCLMDISMDLHANMQHLAKAEAIKRLEDQQA